MYLACDIHFVTNNKKFFAPTPAPTRLTESGLRCEKCQWRVYRIEALVRSLLFASRFCLRDEVSICEGCLLQRVVGVPVAALCQSSLRGKRGLWWDTEDAMRAGERRLQMAFVVHVLR